ncbi:MAG: hypothetical protein ACT4TC_18095 [Myxococcaceae bacterium]
MTTEGRRALGFLVALGAAVFCVAVFIRPLLRFAAGPESEILEQIKLTEKDGLTLTVPGLSTPLVARRVHFDRISVVFETEHDALAHATLDFEGTLGRTEVSSLGVERIVFKDLKPSRGLAPQLTGLIAALNVRRLALSEPDGELRDRRYAVKSWHLRLERDSARVVETFLLTGSRMDRPIEERGDIELRWEQRDGTWTLAQSPPVPQ